MRNVHGCHDDYILPGLRSMPPMYSEPKNLMQPLFVVCPNIDAEVILLKFRKQFIIQFFSVVGPTAPNAKLLQGTWV